MDHIDEKILDILQKDGRISMQKLAKLLPMSVPATCERVRKLEDSGVIAGYSVRLDPVRMGNSVNAYILFTCKFGQIDRFLEWAVQEPRIVSAHFLAGRFTLMLEVSCADMEDYSALVDALFPLGTSESYIKINPVKAGGLHLPRSVLMHEI